MNREPSPKRHLHGFWAMALTTLLALTPFAALYAQTGTITGTVTNEQGEGLAGAQVLVVGTGQGALTHPDGQYTITNVEAGSYTLQVTFLGYRTETADVTVRSGAEISQDFTLVIDPLGLEGIVVTAQRTPIQKLRSSTAITTIPEAQIEQEAPRSTADLLKTVPGFYVESSGGEVNNNLFARGLPADGSYRYVVFLENGMMAFDANDIFFMGADNLIRVDENVDRIEAVRGGSSALFGSNAPGGLVNLINKTGGPDLAGSFKVSVGTDGLNRYDANVNGPVADDWRFSIGGYYRFDDGVRDPGYPAARGGQIKANITRLFDRGLIRVYGNYINDSNILYLPLPARSEDTGETITLPLADGSGTTTLPVVEITDEFAPGLEDDATLTTNDANFARIPLPQGNGEFTLPLERGVGQTGGSFKGELSFTFPGDWEIQNIMRMMWLDHEWNGMPPGQTLTTEEFADGMIANLGLDAATTATFTFEDDGSPFDTPNGLVQEGNIWHVERPVSNFSNQFMVRKSAMLGETEHNFTIGTYFGHYTADNLWMFNRVLTNIQNAPELLNLILVDPAGDTTFVTENGFTSYLDNFVRGQGNATIFSVFAGDEIQLTDRLRLDLGARFERDEYEQNVENTQAFDLEGPSLADNTVNWGDRSFTRRQEDYNEWAASVGLNYLLTETVAIYGRGTKGYKMPLLDQFLFDQFADTAETLLQAEGGVKVTSQYLGLTALVYWLQIEDFPSQDVQIVDGQTQFVSRLVGEARTIGFEAEAVFQPAPLPGLRLNGQVTLQDHEYTQFVQDGLNLEGNWVRRIPKALFKVGGSYSQAGVSVGGDWSWYGKRFSNNANSIELPSFSVVNARAAYTFENQGVTLTANAQNLLDGTGFTEGDPRFDESGALVGFGNARPILPRRFVFALRYAF